MAPSVTTPKSWSKFLLYGLAFTTAVNIASVFFFVHKFSKLVPPDDRTYSYIEEDYPAQLPLKLSTVALSLDYIGPYFSLYADEEWGTQFPPSDGFTDLGPANRTFTISMIHQMHCLDIIRVGFVANRSDAAVHLQHCLRYMRQIVLCNADTTLEPAWPAFRDGIWHHSADGIGSVHRCKDWVALRRYLNDNPAHEPAP